MSETASTDGRGIGAPADEPTTTDAQSTGSAETSTTTSDTSDGELSTEGRGIG
jgi:hypothetical protein